MLAHVRWPWTGLLLPGGLSLLEQPTSPWHGTLVSYTITTETSGDTSVSSSTTSSSITLDSASSSASTASTNQRSGGSSANIQPSIIQVTTTVTSFQLSIITLVTEGPEIVIGPDTYPFETKTRTITQSSGGDIVIRPTEVVCGTVTLALKATGTAPQALSCQGAMMTANPASTYGNFSALANELNVVMDDQDTVENVEMSPSGVIIAGGADRPIPSGLKGETDLGAGITAKPGGPEKKKKSNCKFLFGAIKYLAKGAKDAVDGVGGLVKDTAPFVKGTADTLEHAAITSKLNLVDQAAQDLAYAINSLTDEFPSDFADNLKSLNGKFNTSDIGPLIKTAWLEARHMTNVVNSAKTLMDAIQKDNPPDLIKEAQKQLKDLLDPSVPKPKGGLGRETPGLSSLSDLEPVDDLPTASIPTTGVDPTTSDPQSTFSSQITVSGASTVATSTPLTSLPTRSGKVTSLQASTAEHTSISSPGNTRQSATVSTTTGSSSSSSSSSQTPSATPGPYFFTAKFGTDYNIFLNFTIHLDKTSGFLSERSEFPEIEKLFYVTNMSEAKAEELKDESKYPFISAIMNVPKTGKNAAEEYKLVMPHTPESEPRHVARAPPINEVYPDNPDLSQRSGSGIEHLGMLSPQRPGDTTPNAYILCPFARRGQHPYRL
ncbi:uncharacterized protein BDZ99DRAFT_526145 [Mytilinidion resinicola]|uniref:Uncharacterized protein n=1 Tax=Mytilinidion resinicola TaxID=574789 RepID=A0A6A6Y608_9PEZI|nr:uncharacterized protein BDZ99DRAFT_526145 [Mytilinidion resinicola]KAF2804110.1 hypothetical protein BDZ99DRAFT_526145 [Mytilinidion resinicola]